MGTYRLMMRWGLAGLVLLTGLAFASAAEIEPGLPDNTTAVLTINLKQLLHAPLVKQHVLACLQQACRNTDVVRETLEMLALDPIRDLDRLTAASVGSGGAKSEGVVILRGRFDTARFHLAAKKLVKEHGDRFELHKDDNLKYVSVVSTGGHGAIIFGAGANAKKGAVLNVQTKGCLLDAIGGDCIALLDKNTLVLATSEDLLKESCKHIADKDTSSLNKPMRRLLMELESKQTIAFAGIVPQKVSFGDNSEAEEESSPPPLRDLTGSISLAEDFKLRCAVRATSADDARTVMKGFEELRLRADGLMTLLAGSSKEYAFLKDIPRSFLAVRKGRIILVEGRLAAETLDKLLGACSAKGR